MRQILIKNLTNDFKYWLNKEYAPLETFLLPLDNSLWLKYATNEVFICALMNGEAGINDFTNASDALNFLRDDMPKEVIPLTGKNEHGLMGSKMFLKIPSGETVSTTLDITEDNLCFWGAYFFANIASDSDSIAVHIYLGETYIKTFCDWYIKPLLACGHIAPPDNVPSDLFSGLKIIYEYTNNGSIEAQLYINNILTVKS